MTSSTSPQPKDIKSELQYQAQTAHQVKIKPTDPEIFRRYREHKHATIFRREYNYELFARFPKARVCDFGCGTGTTSARLGMLGHQVVGIDLSPENIALAREQVRLDKVQDFVQFVVTDGACADLPAESFDLVVVESVLHHMDIHEGLRKVHELIKPGGHAVIQEPIAFSRLLQWFRDRTPVAKDVSPNERQLNQEDFRLISEKFEIVECRYFHLLTRLLHLRKSKSDFSFLSLLLHRADYFLLKLPGLNHFAGVMVMLCRKKA